MNISGSFVGSRSPKTVDLFHQARLVRITHGTFAIWLDPFGMLDPKVLVSLLPELGVGVYLVKDSSVARPVDQLWRSERAPSSSEDIPKSGMHTLAVCTTPSQLDYSVAL